MRVKVLAVGTRPPDWVDAGFREYARRIPAPHRLELIEIAPARRKGWPPERILADEGQRLLSRVGRGDHVVTLEIDGSRLSTPELAARLEGWQRLGQDLSFLIGGADGLDACCRQRADESLSLSALTFPHLLVRIMLAEQLYRAWTVLLGHPYHRA